MQALSELDFKQCCGTTKFTNAISDLLNNAVADQQKIRSFA